MNAPMKAVASTLTRLRNIAEAGGLSFNEILKKLRHRAFPGAVGNANGR